MPTAFEVLAAHRMNPNEGSGPRADIAIGEKPVGPPQAPAKALFSPELRGRLNHAWFDNEAACGAYDREWAHHVVLHGKQALSEESDEALLERFFGDVSAIMLMNDDGVWLDPHEDEFLRAMLDSRAVQLAKTAVAHWDNDNALDFIAALSVRLEDKGLPDPYAEMLDRADAPKTPGA